MIDLKMPTVPPLMLSLRYGKRTMFIDSHAHIESEDFDGDRSAMIGRALEAGIEIIVAVGNGDISKALKVSAHRFTKSAREKIENAGGVVTVIE